MPATKDLAVYYYDIVNSMPSAIAIVDENLCVHYVNLSFCKLFAVDEKDALDRQLFDGHAGLAQDATLTSLLTSVLAHGVTVEGYRAAFDKPGVPSAALDISARRVMRDGVGIGRTLVVINDVTEVQRSMELKSRAVENSRAQILEVNHRVKNNLASVLSMLRLERRTMGDRAGQATIDRISLRVRSIASLYELLAVNAETGSIQLVSYFRSVARSIEGLSSAAEHRWSVTVEGTELLVNIDDAISIGAIISELIGNAANYAFEGQKTPGVIAITVNATNGVIDIVVADNGIGLTDQDTPSSTGLGMKLVDLYVKSLGAQLERESSPRKGTRYTMRIPHRAVGRDAPPPPPPVPISSPIQSGR